MPSVRAVYGSVISNAYYMEHFYDGGLVYDLVALIWVESTTEGTTGVGVGRILPLNWSPAPEEMFDIINSNKLLSWHFLCVKLTGHFQ